MDAMRGEVKLRIDGEKKEISSSEKVQYSRQNLEVLQGQVLVGKNCHIHNGAVISNSIIGDNCEVLPGVVIRNSVIWKNCKIGARSELTLDVVGNGCVINEDV